MNWLLRLLVIWLSIDIFVIATAWYASTVIAPGYPNWWRRVVIDTDPESMWQQLCNRKVISFMQTVKNEEKRFSHLIKILSVGWEIEEPVILGAMWGNTTNGKGGVYHFVLRNKAEDKTTMLSLPPSPELLVFLAENKVDINSL